MKSLTWMDPNEDATLSMTLPGSVRSSKVSQTVFQVEDTVYDGVLPRSSPDKYGFLCGM
jgi:hypothetical protein